MQVFQIGAFNTGTFKPAASWDRTPGFEQGASVALRLLVRAGTESTGAPTGQAMSEFYVNDIMSHPFTFGYGYAAAAVKLGTLALVVDDGDSDGDVVSDVAAWRMTLPAV